MTSAPRISSAPGDTPHAVKKGRPARKSFNPLDRDFDRAVGLARMSGIAALLLQQARELSWSRPQIMAWADGDGDGENGFVPSTFRLHISQLADLAGASRSAVNGAHGWLVKAGIFAQQVDGRLLIEADFRKWIDPATGGKLLSDQQLAWCRDAMTVKSLLATSLGHHPRSPATLPIRSPAPPGEADTGRPEMRTPSARKIGRADSPHRGSAGVEFNSERKIQREGEANRPPISPPPSGAKTTDPELSEAIRMLRSDERTEGMADRLEREFGTSKMAGIEPWQAWVGARFLTRTEEKPGKDKRHLTDDQRSSWPFFRGVARNASRREHDSLQKQWMTSFDRRWVLDLLTADERLFRDGLARMEGPGGRAAAPDHPASPDGAVAAAPPPPEQSAPRVLPIDQPGEINPGPPFSHQPQRSNSKSQRHDLIGSVARPIGTAAKTSRLATPVAEPITIEQATTIMRFVARGGPLRHNAIKHLDRNMLDFMRCAGGELEAFAAAHGAIPSVGRPRPGSEAILADATSRLYGPQHPPTS